MSHQYIMLYVIIKESYKKQEAPLSLGWADRTLYPKPSIQLPVTIRKQFPRV